VATTFRCSIVTPSQAVLSADANYVSFEAWDGQRGVMSGASPFLTALGIGTARIDLADGTSKAFLIDSGFAQMQGEQLTILTDGAADAASIDRAQAEREYAEAKAKVTEAGQSSPEARQKVERAQKIAATKLALARG
jgi:F-type H+-transporting ATPase subunit epsilon